MIDKPALRARLRAVRDGAARDRPMRVPPAFTDRLTAGTVVAGYVPFGSEADPAPLLAAAADAGCRLALPHVTRRDRPMRFLAWRCGDDLSEGLYRLRQPAADAAEVVPDIILTPLLGFDADGHRLGQGAGFYDRAFARLPFAWRVGVAWSVQQVDHCPADPWDVPLHAIVTESDWIVP
ncbi:5-formyltetrahydrofolate cyclo-ligase [Sphingomonas sp. RIT328]|uniref:5-formyltetrahydrofolate cyclo-ligase n=1 Tax=Sphingomonas sp. RIT328 TaxID=1470591 RepID=UPI00045335D6|nr:5-formyltetrahydrofolate cyclo-ligase [Sphingomonas sp. RIT328]EZP57523.1 5-formyltetrahydrofolate cyclo-ligase [Sphingomonas sp. RIT328]